MARTKGAVNRDRDVRVEQILLKLRTAVRSGSLRNASLRGLADASGVSAATLVHYFQDRDGVVAALMESWTAEGRPHLEHIARPSGDLDQSVRDAAHYLALGLACAGVREMHAHGLIEGLGNFAVGKAYIASVFEPTLDAFVQRLSVHIERGQMVECDPRIAALSLVSPILLAALHQIDLGGKETHPLAWEAFLDQHIEGFLRAYSTTRPRPGKPVLPCQVQEIPGENP